MRWLTCRPLALTVLTVLTAFPRHAPAVAPARGPNDPFEAAAAASDEPDAIDRRRRSWFHRPAMDTPAEQLALADRRRAKGQRRRAMGAYRSLVHQWNDSDEAVRAQLAYA